MRTTTFRFLKFTVLLSVATALFAAELAHAKPRGKNLSLRQPRKVSVVQKTAKKTQPDIYLIQRMQTAQASAERLEQQVPIYLDVLAKNSFQRWSEGVSLSVFKKDFAGGMLVHLKAMRDLMKYRYEKGGKLPGVHDFAFRNLVNQSDYLLALDVTKESLELTSAQDLNDAQKILKSYNQERSRFDKKTLRLAALPE